MEEVDRILIHALRQAGTSWASRVTSATRPSCTAPSGTPGASSSSSWRSCRATKTMTPTGGTSPRGSRERCSGPWGAASGSSWPRPGCPPAAAPPACSACRAPATSARSPPAPWFCPTPRAPQSCRSSSRGRPPRCPRSPPCPTWPPRRCWRPTRPKWAPSATGRPSGGARGWPPAWPPRNMWGGSGSGPGCGRSSPCARPGPATPPAEPPWTPLGSKGGGPGGGPCPKAPASPGPSA